jgi:hypothetical protein
MLRRLSLSQWIREAVIFYALLGITGLIAKRRKGMSA